MSSPPLYQVFRQRTVDYRQAWDLQVSLAHEIRNHRRPNTLLLLEHPPTYTLGRLSPADQILLAPEELERRGISVCETDRGGQVTYHGPGQLVAYPVVDLRDWGGPLKYVRTLEQVIISTLADFHLEGRLEDGKTGVWVGDGKIAAIGVKISRGVAFHGLAINVNTDLSYFSHIVPCGIPDLRVTSIAQEAGRPIDMDQVQYSLIYRFGQQMGFKMVKREEAAYLETSTADAPLYAVQAGNSLGKLRGE